MNRIRNKFSEFLKIKRDLEAHLKTVAIKGAENIRSELAKNGQKAKVSFSIRDKVIKYTIEFEQQNLENIPQDQFAKIFKGFENVPIELLNQEMGDEKLLKFNIDKGMKRTQEQVEIYIQDKIKKLV